jgi:hypothetical protein
MVVCTGLLLLPNRTATVWTGIVSDLSPAGRDSYSPQVAAGPSGTAFAIWHTEFASVQVARYSPASGWSSPAILGEAPVYPLATPHIAVDGAGNAMAIWSESNVVESARYEASTGTWTPGALPVAVGARVGRLAVDSAGNATAVSLGSGALGATVLRARRYLPAGAGWGGSTNLSPEGSLQFAQDIPDIVADPAGNVTVVWRQRSGAQETIRAARYDAATGTWGTTIDIATAATTAQLTDPTIACDAAGNLAVVWTKSAVAYGAKAVQTARYAANTGTWTQPVDLSAVSAVNPDIAFDPAGNAIAVWWQGAGVRAARFTAATGLWSSETLVAATNQSASTEKIVIDSAGDATVVFRSGGIMQGVRYTAAAGTWSAATSLSAAGQYADLPQIAVDTAGNATAVWQRSNGLHFVIQATRWTAASTGTPGAPIALAATLTGGLLTLTWRAPGSGGLPTAYILEAGSAPGLADIASLPIGPQTSWTYNGVPDGRYYLRVRGANANGVGPASNEVELLAGTAPPAAPTGLTGGITNGNLLLQWVLGSGGGPVDAHVVEAGSGVGLTNIGIVPSGPGTMFQYAGVPPGRYFLRVRARNSRAVSGPSNELELIHGLPGIPGAPQNLAAQLAGAYLTLTWIPGSGAAATSFVIEAGTGTGLSNAAVLDTGSTLTSWSYNGVPRNQVFYVRVRGRNGAGPSLPSNEVQIGPVP